MARVRVQFCQPPLLVAAHEQLRERREGRLVQRMYAERSLEIVGRGDVVSEHVAEETSRLVEQLGDGAPGVPAGCGS